MHVRKITNNLNNNKAVCDTPSPKLMTSLILHVCSPFLMFVDVTSLLQEGGVPILFDLCQDARMSQLHAQALRAIATVCCVPESIEELERVGGVESLTDMLGNATVAEGVRAEAAGVVAQILSPSLEQYTHVAGFLENMEDLVRSLTSEFFERVTEKTSKKSRRVIFNAG